jgi:hypothetical protein
MFINMASGGTLTHDPEFGGSNPAIAGTRRNKIAQKIV